MTTDILNLEPALLWRQFKQICDIPHPSGHEGRLVEWIQAFAKRNGLVFRTDEVGNTVVIKPATKGMENRRTIVLQAHIDMVPQKNQGVAHDFEKDAIRPYGEDGWVKATETTLGADNGIGAAALLAVLEDKSLVHGTIEALFTVEEETGLTGAFGLKPGFITGYLMINTDAEEDGHFCIGCAGGINNSGVLKFKREGIRGAHAFHRISIRGLKGGHSGADIHLGRGNAVKFMNRFLAAAARQAGIRMVTVEGGNVRNAIPREAFAVIAVAEEKQAALDYVVRMFANEIRQEYAIAEPDFRIEVEKEDPALVIDMESQTRLINLLYVLPNGVVRMSDEVKGIVETSTNLSVLRTLDEHFEIQSLTRSAVESAKQDVVAAIQGVYDLAGNGATVKHGGAYPGWKPNPHSPLLEKTKAVYRGMFWREPVIEVVHAGLECGIIGNIYPGMDMIALGPTIKFPHSPDEKVEIASVKNFWDLLVGVLREAS
jgi:dipeptidase D